MLKIAQKIGALRFTCCEKGGLDGQIAPENGALPFKEEKMSRCYPMTCDRKTEHIRSLFCGRQKAYSGQYPRCPDIDDCREPYGRERCNGESSGQSNQ